MNFVIYLLGCSGKISEKLSLGRGLVRWANFGKIEGVFDIFTHVRWIPAYGIIGVVSHLVLTKIFGIETLKNFRPFFALF